MAATNEQRAEFAAYALDCYGVHKEGRADYDAPEDMAADLICDLLHLIKAHGFNPEKYLTRALTNYEAENVD
jgi:hypothetical protein